MEKFTQVTSIATPYMRANVDTDIIIPAKHLKSIKRTGFGERAFETVRFDADGNRIADNVFDSDRYKGAEILVTGDNFGCGSSREHAPWAIAELGFRCIIAPSFADIFAGNCVKNGILTVALPQAEVDAIAMAAEGGQDITVNLEDQTVEVGNSKYEFDYNAAHKHMLLNGLDSIGQTLQASTAISAFEEKQKHMTPWLYRA